MAHGGSGTRIGSLRVPWLAAAVAVTVLLSGGCDAVTGSPAASPSSGRAAPAHGSGPAPEQRWGSAAGLSHLSGRPGNRTVPVSERGRYPHTLRKAAAAAPRNKARVARPPARERAGFDRGTSREMPGGRGEHERLYQNADGTQTTEFSATPVNYRRADGSWAPIDSTLTAGDGGWRNRADTVGLRLASRADDAELARVTIDGDHAIAYALSGAAPVAGRAEGGAVVYPGVLPSVDLRLESLPGTLKETLVLRSADAPATFTFPLRLTGLSAAMVAGSVVLSDASGRARAVIPPGTMADSADKPATSDRVSYRLVTEGGATALRVTVDAGWLRDPARRFPVLVDPTVGPPVDSASADAMMTVRGSGSTAGGSELTVGRVGGENTATYLKFGNLAERMRNHTVYGAAVVVTNFDAPSCRARPVTVHPVTQEWAPGTGHRYPGPSVGPALASPSFAYGYIGFGQSQSSCPATPEMIDLGAAGSALVQRWANGQQANHGLSLRASTTDSLAWKKFAGAGANPPKLYVTHTPYNATYAIPKPTPEPAVTRNQDGKVKVTVTNLGAEAWTPAGYYLAYRAYDADTGAAVTQQRAANLPGTVARGGQVTLDATIKALEPGNYFLDFTMVAAGGQVFTDHQVPPGRIVLQVFDVPPVVQEIYPPNGYQTPTLTPLLWARAVDTDAPPGSALQYKFEVCDRGTGGTPTGCTGTAYQAKPSWVVPAGRLSWSKDYVWRAYVKDGANEVTSPDLALLAAVPQPEITSRIANAPYASQDREFDAQVGNYRTAALDAVVANVGPELNLTRTYNSLDPRTDSAFGAGWSSRYDMKVTPDDDGSGNVVVTYPDGQAVRFGRNPDGTFAAPPGRTARLTVDSTGWTLRDRSGTQYQFALAAAGQPAPLSKITDNAGRSATLTYTSGRVTRVQAGTAGRSLRFTWSGNHIATVAADLVGTWRYTYTGDLLTKVCPPAGDTACTGYEYAAGSHYRSTVLDAKPESYWRLGDKDPTGAASAVAVNLGKDAGTYRNVTVGAAGALTGTGDAAAVFNGASSHVELPKGTVKKSRDAAVEVWFKVSGTQTGGPLVGYQNTALSTAPGTGVPVLYTGTDGLLRGQFATGAVAPITSGVRVWDDAWHHAVLSVMGTTQTLYLDGRKVGESTGTPIEHSELTFNQIGAAAASTPGAWPGWGSAAQRFFQGAIDEVAVYSHPLGPAAVLAHYRAGTAAAAQLSKVTLPSGRVGAEIAYDVATDRVREYTDDNGGTWKIGAPLVHGNDSDLRRSIQVLDPANRPELYEYDALAGRLLRTGTPLGLEAASPLPSPSPSPTPTPTCPRPDPQDPAFCTVIPDGSGGPVFVRHPLDGLAVRSFEYDDKGNQKRVVNENGDAVEMTYDDRGNVVSRKTCRVSGQCHTTYSAYPSSADPLDPRSDLVVETRDGRSASATDNTYRTTYSYHFTGQLDVQTNPDGSTVDHDYSNGTEPAVGGGQIPAGMLLSTKDARGKVTRYAYYSNGDTARVTAPSGLVTEFTYDALGRKTAEKLVAQGLVTTYAYDTNSKVTSVTSPATTDAVTGQRHQQQVRTEYDADGNVTRVTVADLLGADQPRVTTTEYDEHGRAAVVTDAEGGETTYSYDRFGNKTAMVDAGGNRFSYAYTARNKIAEARVRDLVLHSYSYDYAGRLASDTDAMGRRLEYQYYADDLLRRVVLRKFHDPDGSTRDYVVEENTYDGAGHLTKRVEGNGSRTTTHTVDRAGKVTATVQDPGGLNRTSTFAFDLNGNVTRTTSTGRSSNVPGVETQPTDQVDYQYDDAGNVTRETVTAGSATRVTGYTYDQRGLRTSLTDPRGNTTNFEHDEAGRVVRVIGPPDDAGVRPFSTAGYDTFGGQTAGRDPLGQVTRTEYDRLGRAVRTIQPQYLPPGASQAVTPVTKSEYDALGNVIAVTAPGGAITRFEYDQLGRVITRDEPGDTNDQRAVTRLTYTHTGQLLSTTGPTGARTEATYDDLDRPVTTTQIERYPQAGVFTGKVGYDDAGNARTLSAPSGATTRNEFDALGRLTRTTSAAGVVRQYGYDYAGRQVRQVDGKGRVTRLTFNQFGDKVADSDLKPGTEEVLRTQTYEYDASGNLVAATDPEQHTTRYEYDTSNRLTRQIEPVSDGHSITTSFGYDLAGNRTRYTDGRGNVTRYTYNSLGLPEAVIEPETAAHPAAADRTWTVGYDSDGRPARLVAPGGASRSRTYDTAGRLRTETGSGAEADTAQRSLAYDLAGRLTAVSTPGGTSDFTYNDRGAVIGAAGASFTYDSDGNLTGRTDAAGSATFGYDRGRLKTLTDGLTGTTQTLGYDAAGAVQSIDYGGGRGRTFTYDDYGHLATDTLRSSANAVVASVGYGYDRNGHVIRKTTAGTAGAGENTYRYDFAGRLTSWTGPDGTTDYEWDDSGNRLSNGARYDERNRLLSDGDYTYTYTARGTLRSRTSSGLTEEYAFDAFDRMVGAGGQSYAYDGLNRVTARNGVAFTYAGPGSNPVAYGSERYGRGPSGELLSTAVGDVERLTMADGHGDIVAELDPADPAAAEPSGSTAYDPFGKRTATSERTGSLGFQGDWTDPDTGHVDMGARWYSPGTGGFVSRDSVNYSGGDSILANRYTYGAGAPLDFADPDGHWPKFLRKAASFARSVVTTAWNIGVSAVRAFGNAMEWVYNKSGLATVVNAVTNTVKGAVNWAQQKAAQAVQYARAAKAAVTAAAKQAVAKAVKYTPLPVLAAVTKPLLKTIGKVVSTTAKLAASVVAVTVTAVSDPKKFAAALYQAAANQVGAAIETVSKAAVAVGEFVAEHKDAILEGLAIVGSIAAGLACTAATAGAAAVACIAGAAALINLAKDMGQGDIKNWKDAAKSAGIGAATGLLGAGAGAVGARVAGAVASKVGAGLGGRALAGGVEGGVSDAAEQLATTGRVNVGQLAMSVGLGAATRGALGGGSGRRAAAGCGGPGNSFTPETAVLMADGSRTPIGRVRVGDTVRATDPTTGRTENRRVTDVIVGKGQKNLVEITVDVDGTAGGRVAKVTATEEHPFWVPDLNRWVHAKDLRPGYRFETADHRSAEVVGTRKWTEYQRVHNLSVDGLHTYYVVAGDTPVLVHNDEACRIPAGQPGAGRYAPAANPRRPDQVNENGNLTGTNQPGFVTSRPSLRITTERRVWAEAEVGPNGGRMCRRRGPNCVGEVMVPPGSSQDRDWDYGHDQGDAWSNTEFPPDVTRPQVIDRYHQGGGVECIPCNRGAGAD